MSKLFHLIEDSSVVIRSKQGVYRQTTLHYKGERIYAKHGSGFVCRHAAGGTSCPSMSWDDLDGAGAVTVPRVGGPLLKALPVAKAA